MALTIGIQISCRNYDLNDSDFVVNSNNEGTEVLQSLPFQQTDIVEINPLVKHLDITSDDVQANMEIAQKFLLDGKVKEALEAFQNSIQLLLNVY